jgi:hypothetical protein
MKRRIILSAALVCVALVLATPLLIGAGPNAKPPAVPERLVIKICNWDGVVAKPALDGFKMPAGKWADFQKQGWQVESYIVAPNASGQKNGLYAVLKR